jgi:peptidoglycan-associated lipoprotein
MLRITKSVVVLSCFLALGACTKKNAASSLEGNPNGVDDSQMAGNAIAGSAEDFQVNVGDRVYFLVDQSSLTDEGQETLRKQAAWLQQYPDVAIQVEGHSDERGTREYNIALSARRATASRNYLISQGVDAGRISSIAFGKERPASLCDAESCWSQNRRSVTVITGGAKTS